MNLQLTRHRDLTRAKSKEKCVKIIRNDEVDRLAKMAIGPPLPKYTPMHLGDIAIKGGSRTHTNQEVERRLIFCFPACTGFYGSL